MTGLSNDKSSSSNSSIVERLSTIDESGSEEDVDSGLENSATTTQETTSTTVVQDQADQMILFTNIETVRSEGSNDDTKSVLSYSSLSVSLKSI